MPETAVLLKVTAFNILISGLKHLRFLVYVGHNDKVKDLTKHISKVCFGRVVKLDVFDDQGMKNPISMETVIQENQQYYSSITSEDYKCLMDKINDPIEEKETDIMTAQNKTDIHHNKLKQLQKIENQSKPDSNLHLNKHPNKQLRNIGNDRQMDSSHVIALNDNSSKQEKKNDTFAMEMSTPAKDTGCCCCALI